MLFKKLELFKEKDLSHLEKYRSYQIIDKYLTMSINEKKAEEDRRLQSLVDSMEKKKKEKREYYHFGLNLNFSSRSVQRKSKEKS